MQGSEPVQATDLAQAGVTRSVPCWVPALALDLALEADWMKGSATGPDRAMVQARGPVQVTEKDSELELELEPVQGLTTG